MIERAAVMASGRDAAAILRWVVDHGGIAEEPAAQASSGGLHGARGGAAPRQPLRYVLPRPRGAAG